MTLKGLIARDRVRATAEWADTNPNMDGMPDGSSHWQVTLRRRGRQLTVPFSMGPAHSREPNAEDVLECLLSDASGADQDFESWAADLGFDVDSRRAERTYKAVQALTRNLQRLLAEDFEAYLYADR